MDKAGNRQRFIFQSQWPSEYMDSE